MNDYTPRLPQQTISLRTFLYGLLAIVENVGFGNVAKTSNGNDGCTYGESTGNGFITPVCIIGHYVASLGLLGLIYNAQDAAGACDVGGKVWDYLAPYAAFDTDAQTIARVIQRNQDSGQEWGAAFYNGITDYVQTNGGHNSVTRDALYSLLASMRDSGYSFVPSV